MFNNNHKFNMLKKNLCQRNSYVIQAMLKVEAPELHPSTIASKQRLSKISVISLVAWAVGALFFYGNRDLYIQCLLRNIGVASSTIIDEYSPRLVTCNFRASQHLRATSMRPRDIYEILGSKPLGSILGLPL